MPYLSGSTAAPVYEEPPPEEQIPPPEQTGPITLEETTAPQQASGPITLQETTAAPAGTAVPEPPPHGILHDVGDALGGAIQPVVDALPEPVQNLADIAGQPVGGIVDVVTDVGGKVRAGDLGGAALAGVMGTVGQAGEHVTEATGRRVAEGKPATPQNEVFADPGQIPAILGGLVTSAGRPGKQDINDWATANPDLVAEANELGGGSAVVDAYLESTGASSAPPPQLSNPLDAGAGAGNILQSAANVAGAIPESIGGWVDSAQRGTLAPFIESQAAYALMDPLSFLPPAWGDAAWGAAGRAAKAGISRAPSRVGRMLEKTPLEAQRLEAEQAITGGQELVTSRRTMLDETPPAGATPAAGVTPGPDASIPPPDNGPLVPPPDMGQPAAAAPPRPPVGERTVSFTPEYGAETMEQVNARRAVEQQARQAPPDPERPDSARAVPRQDATRPPAQRAVDVTPESERVAPSTGDPIDGLAPVTPPPSRRALGLSGSRWTDVDGKKMVRGRGMNARIDDEFRKVVDDVYDDMWDAPAEQFYESFGDWSQTSLDPSDVGIFSRYRGAMTQGNYLFDDWPSRRVRSELRGTPNLIDDATGEVNWGTVADLMVDGATTAIRNIATKAYAGKRNFDLYAHRIATSPTPHDEVTRLIRQFHFDQLADRFQPGKVRNEGQTTQYWRDRAEALSEVIRRSNYLPDAEALANLQTLNLLDEARLAFPDVPEMRLAPSSFGSGPVVEGSRLMVTLPGGARRSLLDVADTALLAGERVADPDIPAATVLDEAIADAEALPAEPAAEELRPLRADTEIPPEEFTQRQATRAAYDNAPPALQAAVADDVLLTPEPVTTPYGIIVSEQAARDLALPSEGKFKFKDGYTGSSGMSKETLLLETLSDVEFWANVEEMGNWTTTADATKNRRWRELDARFNPDGSVDRQAMRGVSTDQAKQALRDDFAFRVWSEAQDAALPRGAPTTRLGKLNSAYMGFVRRNMLFNYLRVPSYILQNQITNTINLGTRVGLDAVIDYWTSPSQWRDTFRSMKAASKGETHYTFWGSLEKQIGLGHKPNIPMTHSQYLDRVGGTMPKGLETLSRVFAPNTAQWMGQVPDQFAREAAATSVVMKGYRKLNRELIPKVTTELHRRGVPVSPQKIDAIVREFLDAHRAVTDANSGTAYRSINGRASRYEPVWNPDELGTFLRRRLTEDMARAPDATDFRNAVDRVVRDTKSAARTILDEAEAKVDAALFDWRNTNADQALSKVFFFHYWQSRQGGLYVSEMIKRPWVMASYGRMMEEMQAQSEELNQPAWLTGFFQFQNSVAGFSTWFSPFDLAQSLLTFADWQMGADESAYKDLTALGTMWGQSPFLIHPLLQFVAYEIGALGPDYYAPPLTGTESFGARAIDLLNLGNAQDAGFMAPFNAMGIGVDAYGNKVPIPTRPLQELYAKWGNAISTALAPITGLDPVEVANAAGSQERNINAIVEQDLRRNNPNLDQMEILRMRDEILSDHGSEEYQSAYRKASEMPFMSSTGLGGLGIQGLTRLVSPIPVYNWVEQTNLDRWNLTGSGYAPDRDIPGLGETTGELDAEGTPILTAAGETAKDIANASKYGASSTQEARELGVQRIEYDQIMPADMKEANAQAGALYGALDGELTENVMIGGVEYTPDQLGGMTSSQLYSLGTQLLADYGYTRDQVQETKNAQTRYLADHPDVAAYKAYTDLVDNLGPEQFTQQTALENPGFAQFVRTSMVDQTTGKIGYEKAFNPDAFLASQGVRPSVYSPVVGNEPSRVAGGYPALAGGPTDQPLLPQAAATQDIPMFEKTGDADGGYYDDPPIATLGAGSPVQVLKPPDEFSKGLALVSFGQWTGYVDAGLLSNASPAAPAGPVGAAPAPIEPTGGIAAPLGGIFSALGGAKDALVGGLTGIAPQPSTSRDAVPQPVESVSAVEDTTYGLSPWAEAGITEDLVNLIIPGGNGSVGWDFRDPVGADHYGNYFTPETGGHGTEHPGVDIWGDYGDDVATPIDGQVVCTGSDSGEPGVNGFGCAAFKDTDTGGAGKVEVQIDRDKSLVFGHMQTTTVAYGQQVDGGAVLGGMGGMSGIPHIHLEARLWSPDGSYQIVDPTLMLAGYYDDESAAIPVPA